MRTIFHLDLDAFFVSVERILNPSLKGKPVIVGADPNGRGVVAACSYEARRYGLHSAMPIRQAFKLCPQGIYLHGHFHEYENYSEAVKNILQKFAPQIEQASIDEFYMDFSGCKNIYKSYSALASLIQKEIQYKLNLPSSIGIAGNKTVAKIASDCMKPQGITYIYPGMEKEFLRKMPVETIPGVGKVTLKSLHDRGFYLIGDLAKLPVSYFAAALGQNGIDLWEKANGKGTEYLTSFHEQKSVSKEHTFRNDVISIKIIQDTIFELTGKVSQILRDHNWQASTISIKLRYSDFNTITRAKTVPPINDDKMIYETAVQLIEKAYTRRVGIRLIGIHLSKFSQAAEQQFLFETEDEKRKRMLGAVDELRSKFGFDSVKIGSV